MRKQIAAANWKMNLTYQEAESFIFKRLIEADSTVFWLPSITEPEMLPVLFWANPIVVIKTTRDNTRKIFFILLVLVLVFNYYTAKVGTMQYKEHCLVVNGNIF